MLVDQVQQRLQRMVHLPDFEVPEGRWLELPRRGRTWLTDVPGPTEDAPAVVLLHAVGCTGLLTWFPAIATLSRRYRVITFDQRWHGRGIVSDHFAVSDCADDAATVIGELGLEAPVVAGYSMGSIVAQRVWRQHPDVVGGLVLAATTDHFRNTASERIFHAGMEFGMGSLRALSRSRTLQRGALRTAEALVDTEASGTQEWALEEWRQTSPWAIAQAVASLGRFHSTPWLPRIDVPTAVVVTTGDKVLSPERQRHVAATIPGATVHEAPIGHAGCVLSADRFVPVFREAVDITVGRIVSQQRADNDAPA